MRYGCAMADDPLAALRDELDGIDDELLTLLNRRARTVENVGALKKSSGGAFYVPERERAIIERLSGQNDGPFPNAAIGPVMQEVISACLSIEEGQRIAYLGPEGTFTHQAVLQQFGRSARCVPCGTIAAVFAEVERGATQFGVVPVENSSQGSVAHTLDSFIESELRIVAEVRVKVSHSLLVGNGMQESDITRVYSHPQALAQCAGWLRTNLAHVALVETASTADAARTCRSDHAGAAIASAQAARVHGLEVLRSEVQDRADNVTRFLVIGRPDRTPTASGDDKTSVMLALAHDPGALCEVLRPFSEAQINLSKIESRPAPAKAWEYVFFLDLDGHAESVTMKAALDEVAGQCPLFEVLGTYRKAAPSR
jgi:chorismate mutase/prephenate dehydratase